MRKKKKILVVEDEAHLAKGLKFNLEREGYDIVVVDNGQRALDALAKDNFDLVILDLMLPELGGLEVARQIQRPRDRPRGRRRRLPHQAVSPAGTAAPGEGHPPALGMVPAAGARP